MAELSGFWTTGGTAGDQQSSYTQAHWSIASSIMADCAGFEGVAPRFLNVLFPSANGANTVAVDTGGAIVDGKWYYNDASQDVNVPSAVGGGNTRIDRIVLRADWANFNVSLTRIAGTDAVSPTAPAITQTSGTTYDIKICKVLVNTGGTVTVTDERTLAAFAIARQGGSLTDQDTQGATNYKPGAAKMQYGAGRISSGQTTKAITFPVAYAYKPIVLLTLNDNISGYMIAATSIATTGFEAVYDNIAGVPGDTDFSWIAIGQMAASSI
jgi:hypothetical protein